MSYRGFKNTQIKNIHISVNANQIIKYYNYFWTNCAGLNYLSAFLVLINKIFNNWSQAGTFLTMFLK